ncbi:hypothetical protein Tco_1038006 [Tanacetum coccineum]
MLRDRLLPGRRGGCLKVLATFSVSKISLGLLDRLESSPWLGPWYGYNMPMFFLPLLLSQAARDTIETNHPRKQKDTYRFLKVNYVSIQMGRLTHQRYFTKMIHYHSSYPTMGSTIDIDRNCHLCINCLSEKTEACSNNCSQRSLCLTYQLFAPWSTEEMRPPSNNRYSLPPPTSHTTIASCYIHNHGYQDNRNNHDRDARTEKQDEICRNFGRGPSPGFQRFAAYAALQIITSLHAEFSMTDLGSLNYFLSISMTRNASGMFLSQLKSGLYIISQPRRALQYLTFTRLTFHMLFEQSALLCMTPKSLNTLLSKIYGRDAHYSSINSGLCVLWQPSSPPGHRSVKILSLDRDAEADIVVFATAVLKLAVTKYITALHTPQATATLV